MKIPNSLRWYYPYAVSALIFICLLAASFCPSLHSHGIYCPKGVSVDVCIQDFSAENVAYYTKILAYFTLGLVFVGIVQGCLIGFQINLAQQELNATHRPKIITRFFRPNVASRGSEEFMDIYFYIVNEGDAKATITEIGTRVFNWPGPYTKGAREIQFDVVPSSSELENGAEAQIFTSSTFPRKTVLASGPTDENDIWWCIGYIRYKDVRNITRVTGFCRKWNYGTKSWDREKNDDWEYAY